MQWIMEPEQMTRVNLQLARYRLLPWFGQNYNEYPELSCSVLGMHFKNPIGLAAGFDRGLCSEVFRVYSFPFSRINFVKSSPVFFQRQLCSYPSQASVVRARYWVLFLTCIAGFYFPFCFSFFYVILWVSTHLPANLSNFSSHCSHIVS